MMRSLPAVLRVSAGCALALALAALYPASPGAISSNIVISQVYGGGGNTNAPHTHDYIELFNRGNAPVSIAGWSLQYASATGTGSFGSGATQITELPAVTINPGQYFLVQQVGGSIGAALPAPDFADPTPINMSGTAGKVALVNTTTGLACNGGSTPCTAAALATVVDLIGYGNANFFEGTAAAPGLSNTTAGFRADAGCSETDQNASDFASAAPAPRTSASPLHLCDNQPAVSIDNVTVGEGDAGIVTATFTVTLSSPSASNVTFDIATQDDSATVAGGDYVANSAAGQVIPAGQLTSTFEVVVNGDVTVETNESFFVNVTSVTGAELADGQGIGTITNDDVAPPVFDVVISQIYGGGGNSGALYRHDFIELFNRGTTPVDLTGWSVQYLSATGTGTWQITALNGTIAAGGYYLVQQAAGTGGTAALPTPDATGTIPLGSTAGKVALRTTTTALTGACAAGPTIVDLVGYGNTPCFEGSASTAATSNTTAASRKHGGFVETNNNANDFSIGSPNPRNRARATRPAGFASLTINAIQGTEFVTPHFDQNVTTTGIVTGRKTNGFFLQMADAEVDGDAATSDALFVFTSAAPGVTAGDAVTVRGTTGEFFGLTQIESTVAGDVIVNTSGNPLPAPIVLTRDILNSNGSPSQLERFEGMRMHAASLVSVAPTDGFGETVTVLGGVARPMREPGIERSLQVPPDPNTGEVDCCIPRWDENPERIAIDSDGLAGAPVIPVTSNVTFSGVTGPLDYTFGAYKLLPEAPPVTTGGMSAVPAPVPAANEFTVGSYNIENFNSGNAIQLRKASLAIRTVMRSPDLIGVIEIRDLASLQALATQINDDAVAAGEASPAYMAQLVLAPSGGTQHLGFLVKTSRVSIEAVTQERADATFVNPASGATEDLHDRPPLVLRATVDPAGVHPGRIIVVVNHLRSFIDAELVAGDGPRVRAKRTAQAESVAGLLQELQTGNPGTPVISVGDYNAYQFSDGYTDPIGILKGTPTPGDQVVVGPSPDLVNPNFENLTDLLTPDQRYSFIFEGTPQALDHVLVNTEARLLLQRYAIARANADFPEVAALTGDATRPERSSDHDMPVAYFAFPGTPIITLAGGATINVEACVGFTDPGATAADNLGPLAVSVSGAVDPNVPGTYTISYTASNRLATTTVTRTVQVADTTPPSLTLIGAAAVTVEAGASWTDPGAVATDTCGGDLTGAIQNAGSVNTAVPGVYVLTYTVSDGTNIATSTRTVTVADTVAPWMSPVFVAPATIKKSGGRMVDVLVLYLSHDVTGRPACSLDVTSSDPVSGKTADWQVLGPNRVRVRADRTGKAPRIYTIAASCSDGSGNTTTRHGTVTVR